MHSSKAKIQHSYSQCAFSLSIFIACVSMSLWSGTATPGIASLWKWGNHPERSSGTRRWAYSLGSPSSTCTWCYKAHQGSSLALAFCSLSLGSGSPLGWTCLNNRLNVYNNYNTHYTITIKILHLIEWDITRVRNSSICHYFSEENPKWPHIRFYGEGAIVNRFWGSPFNGELCAYKRKR